MVEPELPLMDANQIEVGGAAQEFDETFEVSVIIQPEELAHDSEDEIEVPDEPLYFRPH